MQEDGFALNLLDHALTSPRPAFGARSAFIVDA
ncbi:MAG: hypothetical protein ACI9HH_003359, partial [Pseudomonadota bacterium]